MRRRIGVVGSRGFVAAEVVASFIDTLPPDTTVVSGGAVGVDTWAVKHARTCGLKTIVYRANWDKFGRSAGPIRNAKIVRKVEEIAAFWDGASRGTLNTIALAAAAGLPVRVFDTAGKALPLKDVLRLARERGIVAAIEKARR